MSKHVQVGNLPHDPSSDTLRSTFEQGVSFAASINFMKSPKTGESRGSGFIQMGRGGGNRRRRR